MTHVSRLRRAALAACALVALLTTPALAAETAGQTIVRLEQAEFGIAVGLTRSQEAATYDAELEFIAYSTWDGQSPAHVAQSIAAAREQLRQGGLDTATCNRIGCGYAGLLGDLYDATMANVSRGDMPYALSFQAGLDAEVTYLLRMYGNAYTWT